MEDAVKPVKRHHRHVPKCLPFLQPVMTKTVIDSKILDQFLHGHSHSSSKSSHPVQSPPVNTDDSTASTSSPATTKDGLASKSQPGNSSTSESLSVSKDNVLASNSPPASTDSGPTSKPPSVRSEVSKTPQASRPTGKAPSVRSDIDKAPPASIDDRPISKTPPAASEVGKTQPSNTDKSNPPLVSGDVVGKSPGEPAMKSPPVKKTTRKSARSQSKPPRSKRPQPKSRKPTSQVVSFKLEQLESLPSKEETSQSRSSLPTADAHSVLTGDKSDGAMKATLPQLSDTNNTAVNTSPDNQSSSVTHHPGDGQKTSLKASPVTSKKESKRSPKTKVGGLPSKATAGRDTENRDGVVSKEAALESILDNALPHVVVNDPSYCLVDPSSFICPPASLVCSGLVGGAPSLSTPATGAATSITDPCALTTTTHSLSSPSTLTTGTAPSFVSPSAPVSSTATSLIGPLTSSLLGPTNSQPPSELDGLMDWFNFEDCVQTATQLPTLEAKEPFEKGQHESGLPLIQNQPATPQSNEDIACTQVPVSSSSSASVFTTAQACSVADNASPSTVTVALDKQKKMGKKAKSSTKKKKSENLETTTLPVKRGRGRPRKKPKEQPLPIPPSAIKKELLDFSQEPAIQQPLSTAAVSKPVSKKKKLPRKSKNTKATATLITGVFDKLAQEEAGKQNPAPHSSSMHQISVEDSGYSTCISGSDSSSRSSRVPISHSPVESIMSPVLLDNPHSEIGNMPFDERSQPVLIKDPILLGSSVQEPIPIPSQDITVSVLELGQCDVVESHTLNEIPQVTTTNILPELEFKEADANLKSGTGALNSEIIFPELDALLNEHVNTSQIFNPDEMVILKSEDLNKAQEIIVYDDEEDILNSETVNNCIKELQQAGRLGGAAPPVTDGVSHNVEQKSSVKQTHTQNVEESSSRVRKIKLFTKPCTASPSAKRIKLSESPSETSPSSESGWEVSQTSQSSGESSQTSRSSGDPSRGSIVGCVKRSGIPFSMIHSRTKSGRISKPSARMISSDFLRDNCVISSKADLAVKPSPLADKQGHTPPNVQTLTSSKPVKLSELSETNIPGGFKVRKVTENASKMPLVKPSSPTSNSSSLCTPGNVVCHSPKSSFKVKLKDFNVKIPCNPIFQHKLTSFSFKLPELSTSSAVQKTGGATEAESGNLNNESKKVSFSYNEDVPEASERIVTINEDPTRLSSTVEREVKFKDPAEITTQQAAATTSAASTEKNTSTRVSLANTLTMSLDTILKEMEETSKQQKSADKELGSVKGTRSHDLRVVKIKSDDSPKAPVFDRLAKRDRFVCFAEPTDEAEFDGSLTDKDITELLFSPLDVDSSLDKVLQGDSLFGGRLEPEADRESRINEKESSCSLAKEFQPVTKIDETRDTSLVKSAEDEGTGNIPKATGKNPPRKPSVSKTSLLKRSVQGDKATAASVLDAETHVDVSDKSLTPLLQLKELVESPILAQGQKSPVKEKLRFKLSVDSEAKNSPQETTGSKNEDTVREEPENEATPTQHVLKKVPAESVDEDLIDLHADDVDMFDTDTKDTPLSNLFRKPSLVQATSNESSAQTQTLTKKASDTQTVGSNMKSVAPKTPSAPSLRNCLWRQKNPFFSHGSSPGPASDGGSSPGYDNPPVLMLYKKQQVSQWVAEQQRRAGYGPSILHPLSSAHHKKGGPIPHNLPPPVPVPRGRNRNGNLYNEGNGGHFHIDGTLSPPPPPPPPPQLSPPLFTAELPQGSTMPGHAQDLYPGAGSVLEGYCKYYLRGKCEKANCWFKHAPLSIVPLNVMEAALFQSGVPVDHLSMDVLCRYSDDIKSCTQLQAKHKHFTDLVHALLNNNLSGIGISYHHLSHTVKFNQPFLVRLMELCSQLPTAGSVEPLALADRLYSDLVQRQEMIVREIYYYYMKILNTYGASAETMKVYEAMRSQGESPNYDTLLVMLRLGKALEHRVVDLLDDLQCCSPSLSIIQKARCVNRLIDVSDIALLLKHTNRVGSWFEKTPVDVINTLSFESFDKLLKVFAQTQTWSPLLALLHNCPKHLPSVESSQLCEMLNSIVMALGPSEKVANVMGMLSEEQLSGITSEVWNCVIADCAEQIRVQKAMKFCRVAASHMKQLSIDTSSSLMSLYLSQGNPSAAISTLKLSLEHNPSALPPLPLLTSLCKVMESPQDLQLIVSRLLFTGTMPPPAILQCLLTSHSKHKAYSELAEVVKLSLDYHLILDKLFYQKVLVELRHWGKDQDAISTVYKALRKVENLDVTEDGLRAGGLPTALTEKCASLEVKSEPPQQTALSTEQPFKSTPLPAPLPLKPAASHPSGLGSKVGVVKGGVKGGGSLSLENVLQQSATQQDHSSLINLIEVNGAQGQFGAVASILISFPGANSHYDNQTVHAIWRAVTTSKLRAANAFSNFLNCLSLSRAAVAQTPSSPTYSSLMTSDRWLVSQVGIALLKLCEQKEDWQSGFVVLHHLHRFGVHYVKLSQPSANLPPCMPIPPSPCMVALTAIIVCLHINQVNGALEVLQGCDWIKPSTVDELSLRTKLLAEMAEKCLQLRQNQNAWKCLEAIDSGTIMKKYVHIVTNLHNKLLQTLLATKDTSFALRVYHTMRGNKLQCLPSYFSCLLQSLSSTKQEPLARNLCRSAISDSCYCALTRDTLFRVTLPVGLVRIELHLLLEDHLKKIAQKTEESKFQDLYIQFNAGSRSNLEHVFSMDFDPPLSVQFSTKNTTVTIPSLSLREWCKHHHLFRPSAPETTRAPILSPSSTTSVLTCSTNPLASPSVKPKPHNIKASPSLRPPSVNEVKSSEVLSASHDCAQGSALMSRDSEQGTSTSGVVKAPPSSVTMEPRPVEPGAAGPVRLRGKRSASEMEESPEDVGPPVAKRSKLEKKQFKQNVCKMFVEQLKPHYRAGKFKTSSDYTHLLKILSLSYFKTYKSRGNSVDTNEINSDITNIVANLMSRIHVYTMDMDSELGLSCSTSDNS